MMRFLKNSGVRLISVLVWVPGLSTFVILGSFYLFVTLFIDPRRMDSYLKVSCRLMLRMLFIRVRVLGLEHIQRDRAYLFMSNHVNLFDVFVLYGYIPLFCRGVELDDHFHWPLYGKIIQRMGMIPISHSQGRMALKSLELAKKAVSEGDSIIILPEGHRTLTGQMGPFKRGTFMLAKEAGADIIPMMMQGAYEINHKGSLLIRPGKMILHMGEPVRYEEIKEMPADEIKTLVRERMSVMV